MTFLKLIDDFQQDIIKSTQDLISIKSVEEKPLPGMPFGEGPYKALDFTLSLAESMGFEVKNLEGYAGHIDLGDGVETVGVLGHVDIVPEGEGWTYPPYSGEVHDGKIYGRGTTDDKGPVIATLYAMKALKETGVKLSRKIRLIIGANEETGWGCMNYYFEHEKAPDMAFTPDADFPVIYGEKGIIVFDLVYKINDSIDNDIYLKDIKGGNAPNMVPDHAEAVLEVKDLIKFEEIFNEYKKENKKLITVSNNNNEVKVIAKGISAHGSTPEKGENAISNLFHFLGTVLDNEFVNLYNERIAFKHYGESIGCGFEDEVSGKLNFNVGMIKVEDGKLVLTINVRYPIESNAKDVYNGIRDNLNDTNIELVESFSDMKPLYVPLDDFLVEKLMKVYREQTGDVDSKPITIGGGTYARAMKNAVAFGPMLPGQTDVAHQKDEYISIDHLMKITKIYAQALYELAK